jgi:hypothetical protein
VAAAYDYLTFSLERGRAAHERLGERLVEAAPAALIAQFAPQLGWAANEAAALVSGEITEAALQGPPIAAMSKRRLVPTVRPTGAAPPRPGGIHVHRWFVVKSGDVDEFVALSEQAWPSFEAQFAANIFGLFRAEETEAERAAGETSLLLLTRYDDHGVWEASRDPTTDAMQIFLRRQALTLRTRACSSLLVGA